MSAVLPQQHPALKRWARWSYGPHGVLSDFWKNELDKDPMSKDLVFTVELVFASDIRVLVSSAPIQAVSEYDGTEYDYWPALASSLSIDSGYTFGDASSSARTLSIQVPNQFVDAAQIVGRGRVLAGYGEVSLQVDGGDWDERLVLMRGDMDNGVSFGDLGAGMVETSVSDPKLSADMNLSPWPADDDRWPNIDESANGQRYPIVVNRYDDIPALLVDTTSGQRRFLAAYGHGWTISTAVAGGVKIDGISNSDDGVPEYSPVPTAVSVITQDLNWSGSTTVTTGDTAGASVNDWISLGDSGPYFKVITVNAGVSFIIENPGSLIIPTGSGANESRKITSFAYQWQAVEVTDSRGVPVTCVEFTNVNTEWTGSESVHVTVTGGKLATNILDGVEVLARDFTTLGSAGLNRALFSRAKALLGTLDARALINASGSSSEGSSARTLEYIEGELLRSFPMVSMVWDRGGYGPVVTDRRGPSRMLFEPGKYPVLDRVSSVEEWPKSKTYNTFTLRYGYNLLDDTFGKVLVRDPTNSDLCRISREEVGERHMDPLESVTIFDDSVAGMVIDWQVEHMTMPSYYVEYKCLPIVYFFLMLGDNVTLTDDDFSWSGVTATVERMEYQRGSVTVGLRVWWRYYALGGSAATSTTVQAAPQA